MVILLFRLDHISIPKKWVLLALSWHHAMAIFSFKLDKLFILLIPFLIYKFRRHGSQLLVAFRFPLEIFYCATWEEKEKEENKNTRPIREFREVVGAMDVIIF
jgi:hypothetical protein